MKRKQGILAISTGIFLLGNLTLAGSETDFIEQAFDPAIANENVIGGEKIGTSTTSVGKYIVKGGTDVNLDGLKKPDINKRPSLIVQITKFILRMTMVLGVTMIIYNGVLYVVKASKGENPKDILHNILYVGVGILIALFSVIIIRLVASIGTTSMEVSYLNSLFLS